MIDILDVLIPAPPFAFALTPTPPPTPTPPAYRSTGGQGGGRPMAIGDLERLMHLKWKNDDAKVLALVGEQEDEDEIANVLAVLLGLDL